MARKYDLTYSKLVMLLVSALALATLIIVFTGCGSLETPIPITDCTQVYTQAFCDSIRGKDGTNGQPGAIGTTGQNGQNGLQGVSGTNGNDGQTGTQGGTGETGQNGMDGQNGTNGVDGVQGPPGSDGKDSIIEIIDPCGKQVAYDEVLLRLGNDKLYAVYFNGKLAFFTEVTNGYYITTDGSSCYFTVKDNEIITEHN